MDSRGEKEGKMNPILDIMTKRALEQESDSGYREVTRDIMTKYALLEKGAEYCQNCGNFLNALSWQLRKCQECGKKF